jgi:mono/diheme cytochrome c family protein
MDGLQSTQVDGCRTVRTMRCKAVFKWLGLGISGVVGVAVLTAVVGYVLFERELHRTYPLSEHDFVLPTDDASISEGQRLARLRGCFGGCHGPNVNGRMNFSLPDGTRIYAPDLAHSARVYTTGQFARIVRRGVRPDGTSVLANMPVEMFQDLSDEDLSKILAYIKSQPESGEATPARRIGPIARIVALLTEQRLGSRFAAKEIDHQRAPTVRTPVIEFELGQYLGLTVCSECHGVDLRGRPVFGGFFNPNLGIAAAYSTDAFRKLMRTGESLADRDLALMDEVALSRFSSFTDREIDALHEYLKTLAEQP